LEPMSASERRVIHTTLALDPGIATHSEGEGANRHVVITLHGPEGQASQVASDYPGELLPDETGSPEEADTSENQPL
jgi:R3H domain